MSKIEFAEQSLYSLMTNFYPKTFFVGVEKAKLNEVVIVVYLNVDDIDGFLSLPATWEGFRVIIKELRTLID